MQLIKLLTSSRPLRFLVVGGIATLLQYLILILLVEVLATPVLPACVAAFSIAAAANYYLNYHVTFAAVTEHARTLPKFALVACCGLLLNTLSFSVLLGFSHYLVAQIGATLITLVANFVAHQHWTYREIS